jgi:methylated-DNA-[protein]-cysteine S-methyltransferase
MVEDDMTCDEFTHHVDDVLAGDGDRRLTIAMGRHADGCAACRREWERLRLIRAGVADTVAADGPSGADRHVARQRLRSALDRAGHPPIRFGVVPTPVGTVFIGLTEHGVCDLTFGQSSEREYRSALLKRSPEVWRNDTGLALVSEELLAYFAGTLTRFTVPLDLRHVTPFTARVLRETRKITFGRLSSYGALAARLGSPGASRAVGGALGRNPVPIIVPCHRVLAQGGRIGGFTGGVATKRVLLSVEGHEFPDSGPSLF